MAQNPRKPIPDAWEPPDCTLPDIRCIQALDRGDATPEQQKRALAWIIDVTGYYDLSYRPGDEGRRDTDFAEGKRFIGAQIVKLTKLNPAAFSKQPIEPKEHDG